ncbi:hypothetical protein EBR03_05400 [bacterium]|nr:hypothetical protein [bacterium]
MNTPNTKPNLKNPRGIKITLTNESLDKTQKWITQIIGDQRGVKIRPQEIVNWIIQKHSDTLSESEINQYCDKNIDQIEVAQWALNELKTALRRGEKLSLRDLILGAEDVPPPGRNTKSTESVLPPEK